MLLEEDEDEVERERLPQHVSVLTTEYIARGLDDPEYSAFESADDTRLGDDEGSGLVLTDVVVESVGSLKTPPRTFANWRIPSMKNVIAILAEDVPAQETLLEVWKDFKTPFKVMIYTGSFVIEGTILSDDDDPPEFYRQAFRPIEDATISYQMGLKTETIHVKQGLVNVFQIHGYSVEKL